MEIYTDGGARGNPGPAACAFVVTDKGEIIYKENKYLGIATNNFAEYQGVLLALNWLENKLGNIKVSEIIFFLDSELVVRQINGIYKVKEPNLKKLFLEVKERIEKLNLKIVFKNIPREKNKTADLLVNNSLDLRT